MDKILIKIFLLASIVVLYSCTNNEDLNTYLDKKFKKGELNGNVLVLKKGKVHFEKSFGFADGSKMTSLTNKHRFGLGSVYKEFPAVAIMQLYEKGLLKLEDKVSQHISDLPNWSQRITIKNLLQYTSGLPMISWDEYFGNGLSINDSTILNDLKNLKDLEFEPGTDYLYTNNSPFLLIKIAEEISKKSFSEYVSTDLFSSTELEQTIIKEQYPYVDKTLMAVPFNSDFKEDKYGLSVSGMLFVTTAESIGNWIRKLNSFDIVTKESLQFLSQKFKDSEEYESPLGQVTYDSNTLIEHTHHGSMANYECIVRYFEKDDIVIVILTNQKNGNVFEISDTIFEKAKNRAS